MATDDGQKRSRKGLTLERIFATALRIIDTEGLPALNMRRLGGELGVEAMALYRHLPNKQAVLDGVVDLVLAELDGGRPAEDARRRTRRFFASLRSVLAAHPNAIPLVAGSGLGTGRAKAGADEILRALTGGGLSAERAIDAFYALESLTLGYAWLQVAGFVGELPDSEPFIRRVVPPVTRSPGLAADGHDARFDRCLDAVLDSLLPEPSGDHP